MWGKPGVIGSWCVSECPVPCPGCRSLCPLLCKGPAVHNLLLVQPLAPALQSSTCSLHMDLPVSNIFLSTILPFHFFLFFLTWSLFLFFAFPIRAGLALGLSIFHLSVAMVSVSCRNLMWHRKPCIRDSYEMTHVVSSSLVSVWGWASPASRVL